MDMEDFFEKERRSIAALHAALGEGDGDGSKVWVVNDLTGEGANHVCSTQAKAMAVPVSAPGDRLIYGSDPDSRDTGASYRVVGGKVGVGDTVYLVVIGDRGCCSDVLCVYTDKAAAEAGMARIEAMPEINGWSCWVQKRTIQ